MKLALTCCGAVALAFAAPAQAACRPAHGPGSQLVTVDAASLHTTVASVRLWRRSGRCWRKLAGPWRARVGRSGLSRHHREGDGTTPVGVFGFGSTIYGVAADPGVRYRYHRLVCGDWWDEDSRSPAYNRFRHVRCGTRPPFGGGSEALWRSTRAYSHFAVILYNAHPPVPGRGSAIFLHVDVGAATNGCVSLPARRLVRVLSWMRPAQRPRIAIAAR